MKCMSSFVSGLSPTNLRAKKLIVTVGWSLIPCFACCSEMEGIVRRGRILSVDKSDIKTARDVAQQDISKLYLMSYYWTILAMTTVGNLPHPTTKFQYVYVIFQLLGKFVKITMEFLICSNGRLDLSLSHWKRKIFDFFLVASNSISNVKTQSECLIFWRIKFVFY